MATVRRLVPAAAAAASSSSTTTTTIPTIRYTAFVYPPSPQTAFVFTDTTISSNVCVSILYLLYRLRLLACASVCVWM